MAGHMCRQCAKPAVHWASRQLPECAWCGHKYQSYRDLPHTGLPQSVDDFEWCPLCGKRALVDRECGEYTWQWECENCGKIISSNDYLWSLMAALGDSVEALLPRMREVLRKDGDAS